MKTLIIQKSRSIERYRRVSKVSKVQNIYMVWEKKDNYTKNPSWGGGRGGGEEQWRLWPRPRRLFSPILAKILPPSRQ